MNMKKEILGNASWRIDSEEEKKLALLADSDDSAKITYVDFYRKAAPAYHEKGLEMINRTIDVFRKRCDDTVRQHYVVDMLYSLHRFGCMYDEYFLLNFEFLNAKGRSLFITDKNRWDYYAKLNGMKYDMLFKNKAKTYRLFGKYYGREILELLTEDDYKAFRDFRKRHNTFIVKPSLGSGGHGVYIEKESKEADNIVFNRVLKNGPVVIEQIITTVEKMRSLHPQSLNTVRIPTIRKADGTVIIFHPVLRVGIGDAVVDNAGSGGIFAPVDIKTGIVKQAGITEFGQYFFRHPDSGIVLPGFQIPLWNEAIKMVRELANIVPDCRYVGWDCALTENGWIMIEGNLYGQFGDQYITKVGIKKELDKIIDEIENKVKL